MKFKFKKVPLWQRMVGLFLLVGIYGGKYLYRESVVNKIDQAASAAFKQRSLEDMHEICVLASKAGIEHHQAQNQRLAKRSTEIANLYCYCVVFRIDDGGFFQPELKVREIASKKAKVPFVEKIFYEVLKENQWISRTCREDALKGV